MRKLLLFKALMIIIFLFTACIIGEINLTAMNSTHKYHELLYSDVWGTIYNPVKEQCNNNPTITGDGSKIDIKNASKHRWIAISHEMLNCEYRLKILNNPKNDRYRGKIQYGDTIWIDSPYPEINGWWVVRDAKNARYTNSIDFLQTIGDTRLYKGSPSWSGKFKKIKIYKKY